MVSDRTKECISNHSHPLTIHDKYCFYLALLFTDYKAHYYTCHLIQCGEVIRVSISIISTLTLCPTTGL